MINVTYTGQMIPTRSDDDDDEPDIIDLTTAYGYYGSVSFPIRPPTPFADTTVWPQYNADDDTDGAVTWSLPAKQESFQCKTDTPVLHSPKSSSRSNSTWRRTLNKLLKRTKSIERKKVISSPISDITYPYDFGIGEIKRADSVASRSSNGKRVHWIDDDESILNACHHFVEYLKLYVQNIDKNDDNYLKNCQISLDELNSLIDCQQIQEAFDDIIQLAKTNDKDQLIQQQIYIENLISRTVLFTSSAS